MAKNLAKENFKDRLANLVKSKNDFVENYTQSLMKEDGRAHISVDLRHGNKIFETYSSRKDLSSDIYAYVEGVAKYLEVTTPITLEFILDHRDETLEKQIQTEFLGNYRFEFDEKRADYRHCRRLAWWLFFVGVFFLVFYCVGEHFLVNDPNNEALNMGVQIVCIVSWVFIWEAVDKFAFERAEILKDSLKKAQLADSAVVFAIAPETMPIADVEAAIPLGEKKS
jgi:hypothetical protein